jgi:hypothetical protein
LRKVKFYFLKADLIFRKYAFVFLPFIYLSIQVPFLTADPDSRVSWSRGAFTDEGLYLSQIRNHINGYEFDLKESDCFLKSPLFSVCYYPWLRIFGAGLWKARLFAILITTIFLSWLLFRFFHFGILVFSLLFTQYHFFHYAHYAQAEVLQLICLISSMLFFTEVFNEVCTFKERRRSLLFSCLLAGISFLFKLNTLYFITVIPLTLFLLNLFKTSLSRKLMLNLLGYSILFSAIVPVIWLVSWYFPNKNFFEIFQTTVTESESAFKTGFANFHEKFSLNKKIILEDVFAGSYFSVFYISLFLLGLRMVSAIVLKHKLHYLPQTLFSLCWIIIELHKFGYHYLPSRYFLSTIAAVCCFGAWQVIGLTQLNIRSNWLFIPLIVFLMVFNGNEIFASYKSRRYTIQRINNYLGQYDFKGKTLLGTWSPSLSWQSKARTIPLWKEYFYHQNPLQKFHPRVVIAEQNEAESDSAFIKNQINLSAISDSTKNFKVNFWRINVYWLSKK